MRLQGLECFQLKENGRTLFIDMMSKRKVLGFSVKGSDARKKCDSMI